MKKQLTLKFCKFMLNNYKRFNNIKLRQYYNLKGKDRETS